MSNGNLQRLKHVADIRFSNVDKLSEPDEDPVRLCNYTDVYKNERIAADMPFMEATATRAELRRFHLEVDDVVVTKDSETPTDIAVPAVVTSTAPDLVCGYHLAVARPHRMRMDGRFLHRALQADGVREQFYVQANGVTRFGLSQLAIGNVLVPAPPVSTQRRIADFLDRKTAAIDTLIAKKDKLVALLAEKRQALITQAVTKGLDPTVPMKDSGSAWVGHVPVHWECRRLKQISSRVVVGIAQAATHAYADAGIPIVRSTNVRPNRISLDDILFIEEGFANELGSKYIYPGDLLTVRTGNAGVTAVVPLSLPRCQCFTMLITTLRREHSPEFFSFQLNSELGRNYFSRESWGSAQANISVPILQNAPVVVPPPIEQVTIVSALNARLATFDKSIELMERQVDRLREYRQALITAAVTGKLDLSTEAAA
ncbi:MAG: restriction endonuclease subunit S [Deltaproteobacteria bacterium]|nr:restriction endonuclease subunit S [Deltaproteobacteria bacterium]